MLSGPGGKQINNSDKISQHFLSRQNEEKQIAWGERFGGGEGAAEIVNHVL